MPKLNPNTILPTPEEDVKISLAIASDPDDFEIDDEWFATALPATEFFDDVALSELTSLHQSRVATTPARTVNSVQPVLPPHTQPRG